VSLALGASAFADHGFGHEMVRVFSERSSRIFTGRGGREKTQAKHYFPDGG
jgi:hypothetical protein